MEKSIAAIEFGSKKLKMVIGYELDGKVYPIYCCTKKYGHAIENGQIVNNDNIRAAVSAIKEFSDNEMKMKVTVADCLLGLPPVGLYVYRSKQMVNIFNDVYEYGETRKISKYDLRSLYAMTRNSITGSDNKIVDIIPNSFITDNKIAFPYFPEGEESTTLTMISKIHTLPRFVEESYKKPILENEISIKKTIISPNAASYLIATDHEMPSTYVLVDIGSNSTSVSFIGKNELYSSLRINWGGDNITDRIVETFNINETEAEKYKISYGLKVKSLSFKAPFCTVEDDIGNVFKYYPEELIDVISKEVDEFLVVLKTSIGTLLKGYDESYQRLPIVLIGGGAQLNGLDELIQDRIKTEKVYVYRPNVIGARNATYTNCLGMILESAKTPDITEDNRGPAGRLSREE